MYAIFEDGSHQYRVRKGDTIVVDHRPAEPDDQVEFPKVLLIAGEGEARIGAPLLDGARVVATVVKRVRGPKLVIQKFRRRKNHRRKNGHRQVHTMVQIADIVAP